MNLFCCPVCKGRFTFEPAIRQYRCENGHAFDAAAEGYVHLLPSNKMHAKLPGDSKEMVAARRAFLEAGFYQLFSDRLNQIALNLLENLPTPAVLDAGCGEGYYTRRLTDFLRQAGLAPRTAGFDISKLAVKAAAKRDKETQYAVASIFDIPAETEQFDLVLNVFAPIVPEEFYRVLNPGGYLLIAVPSVRHLFGLKEVLYDRPYENEEIDTAYPGFSFLKRLPVRGEIRVEPQEQIQNLFKMTPYFWKTPAAGGARLKQLDRLDTEIGFDFLLYQKQEYDL